MLKIQSYVQPSLIFAGLTFTAGAIILACSPDLATLFVGRVVLGFGVGSGTMVSHPPHLLSCASKLNLRFIDRVEAETSSLNLFQEQVLPSTCTVNLHTLQ